MIEQAILNVLRDSSAITDLVGDTIRVDQLDQGDGLPNIVIEKSDNQGEGTLGSSFGGGWTATMVIRVRAATRGAANRLAATISEYLDSLLSVQVDDILIDAIDLGGDSDDLEPYDDTDQAGYVVPVQFTVDYQ